MRERTCIFGRHVRNKNLMVCKRIRICSTFSICASLRIWTSLVGKASDLFPPSPQMALCWHDEDSGEKLTSLRISIAGRAEIMKWKSGFWKVEGVTRCSGDNYSRLSKCSQVSMPAVVVQFEWMLLGQANCIHYFTDFQWILLTVDW